MLQLLQKMYDQMKDEPRFLIDYKTFTSTIDEMKATAESLNGSHANDVFLVAIEEFRGKLMKRKEAKAKVKEYLAEKEAATEPGAEEEAGRRGAGGASAVRGGDSGEVGRDRGEGAGAYGATGRDERRRRGEGAAVLHHAKLERAELLRGERRLREAAGRRGGVLEGGGG